MAPRGHHREGGGDPLDRGRRQNTYTLRQRHGPPIFCFLRFAIPRGSAVPFERKHGIRWDLPPAKAFYKPWWLSLTGVRGRGFQKSACTAFSEVPLFESPYWIHRVVCRTFAVSFAQAIGNDGRETKPWGKSPRASRCRWTASSPSPTMGLIHRSVTALPLALPLSIPENRACRPIWGVEHPHTVL
jgi:hypothetical protein